MIRLQGINKTYNVGQNQVHALQDINMQIEQGAFVAIQGSSGSGKSTLLNVLGILDSYNSGSYYLENKLIAGLSEHEAARYRNRYIGFVFQSFNLLPFKTAVENVALPLYYQKVPRRKRNIIAHEYLDRMGLRERADHLPSELSGGQAQRVAIARALIAKPRLILADEPTGALDTATSHQIMDVFSDIHGEGVTIIIVTHEDEVAQKAQRIVHMRDGRVLERV
ncbi:MAG: ABC transporter ATP-binding protein [Gammaproteobacteria bacterium]|nr:ABC transporter ATP-binding protein [Gammaproteobacteria bacterium]